MYPLIKTKEEENLS